MFIQTEATPNPSTMKFIPGRVVLKEGTAFFKNKEEALGSPFALRLFNYENVKGVFFGTDFITITKKDDAEWDIIKPIILGLINEHYLSNDPTISDNNIEKNIKNNTGEDSDIVKKIKELIDTRVRPAVAMDGGDIIFENYKKGIVYLHMQGACSGCPSSTVTLKTGIENMLKHYIPEVTEVRQVAE